MTGILLGRVHRRALGLTGLRLVTDPIRCSRESAKPAPLDEALVRQCASGPYTAFHFNTGRVETWLMPSTRLVAYKGGSK